MLTDKEQKHFFAVIMAGGGGTRLWPWSRKEQPKQMLRIIGNRSMFQISVDRLEGIIPTNNIFVVTTAEQAEKLEEQVPKISGENYLLEPMPRGTASVVGLAAIQLLARDPDAVMAVLTADHYIKNEKYFRDLLASAYQCAADDHLVTLGIKPGFASTGMGYIQQGKKLEKPFEHELFAVKRFTEKPDAHTAERFIQSGDYSWNSGMFIWRADRIYAEIQHDLPDLYAKLEKLVPAVGTPDYPEKLAQIWPTIEPVTIDYGVMEKAKDVVVLPAHSLGWSDIGSWESIYGVIPEDKDGNIHINCKTINLDSEGTLTCSENPDKMIITMGMKNVVIVETEKAIMVCPRSETQRVREIVQYLKDHNLETYL